MEEVAALRLHSAPARNDGGFLFEVYDAGSFVGVEAGFFDDVVESAGIVNLFEGELRVCFVGGYKLHCADT